MIGTAARPHPGCMLDHRLADASPEILPIAPRYKVNHGTHQPSQPASQPAMERRHALYTKRLTQRQKRWQDGQIAFDR